MKILIVYHSFYGGTKKYADWLKEELSADCFSVKGFKAEVLDDYDIIIFGGGLYAGSVAGISFVKKNYPLYKDKKWYIFACGATPFETEEDYAEIMKAVKGHIPDDELKKLPAYYFPSLYDYPRMKAGHKMLMKGLNFMLTQNEKKGIPEEKWSKGLKPVIFKTFDNSDRKFIDGFVEEIKSL